MSIPADHDTDDPWMTGSHHSSAVQVVEPEQPALRIETIEGVEPLDAQLRALPKKTVPDALYDSLFGQPKPTQAEIGAAGGDPAAVPPMQTYAILEAAKIINLPELLEDSGLQYRCLFKGDAYDEMKNVAPWIVRLEDGNRFTRNLFTRSDAYWHLWDSEPGLYFRSRRKLDDMWRHLRKFSHVPDEQGKMHFFRFWNHHVFLAWMVESGWLPSEIPSFLSDGKGIFVASALALDAENRTAWQISARHESPRHPTAKPFRIRDQDTPVFRRALVRPLAVKLVPSLREEYREICADHSLISLQLAVESTLMRLHEYGFLRHDILKELVVQDLYLGYPFEDEDATGYLGQICRSDAPQETRYAWLCHRIQDLTEATRTSGNI